MVPDGKPYVGVVAFLGDFHSVLVPIGDGRGRIDEVTPAHVSYTTGAGRKGRVDLDECQAVLARLSRKATYVGVREALTTPPRAHFAGAGFQITFSFDRREALYGLLLDPLKAVGLHTLDGC